jgi:arsenate reductase-like glutaredoxin family protein
MGCKKAQGFLEKADWQVQEKTDAGKERRTDRQALALARSADQVIVARGKKVATFDMKHDPPDDATLLKHLLGPSGNLRAPTFRKGKTLVVGFSEEAYSKVLVNRHAN